MNPLSFLRSLLSFPRKPRLWTGPRQRRWRESCKKVEATAEAVLIPDTRRSSGQAAIELAVFGAILIFILGTIVRSAVGNSYSQNENFKAMRMAMLASWNSSKAAIMSRTSASILFVEDRLSPDFNKYGDLDRNPFIAQGSGTFSYEVLYPLTPGQDNMQANMPVMDVYINGQHFPFTTATYVTNRTIIRSACPSGGPYFPPPYGPSPLTPAQCQQNQCLRNAREWAGGIVDASHFDNVIPVTPLNSATMIANGIAIFQALLNAGVVGSSGTGTSGWVTGVGQVPSSIINPVTHQTQLLTQQEISQIQSILHSDQYAYKLFYAMQVNGTKQFSPTPPTSCSGTNNALCSTLTVVDASGEPYTNKTGDMQYDLLRLGNYAAVESQFPSTDTSCSDITVAQNMRCYIAWQWSASAATTATSIGFDANSNEYPLFDIDGRLKAVTIYGFSQNSNGTPTVSYEDYQGGDIDGTWDSNSCAPKPGLQNDSQIFTFTKNAQNGTNGGTYLLIKEGKLYNPETGQFVRSANKRDTIDLIQRIIQLSNNTGDFCNGATPQASVNGSPDPNPVEVCIPHGSGDNCFSNQQNIASTCFDENDNMIFVRSRLEDRRGHFWITNASGQLSIK